MIKNIYLLKKENKKYSLPNIKLKHGKTEVNNITNKNEYRKITEFKNSIDNIDDTKLWDKAKKLSNLYEIIYLPNKKFKYDSISKYEPLSRAYFKLFEMLVDFNIINDNKKLKIATLAEGPGGFIEAIINYRKRFSQKDNIFAITLHSSNKEIPGWNKARMFLKKNKNINISYGIDKTGNLYKLENILEYASLFNHDADFITADGGFDFSYNFNKQEQLSYRILFCEIVTALSIQKIGGSFICKFFDIYTEMTQSFIYLLFCVYKEVYITKPNTSRSANSEKYIVCKGFLGINKDYMNKLYILVKSLETIEKNKMYIHQLFEFNIDKEFLKKITNINTLFFNNQCNSIRDTLKLINNNIDLDVEYNDSILKQTIIAYKWCKYYQVSINYNSKYLIKYKKWL